MRTSWAARRRTYREHQQQARDEYDRRIRSDLAFMERMLEAALGQMTWPRETLVAVEFAEEGRAALLDVDLPEAEDLPTKTATLAKGGRRLVIREKSERTVRGEYARHVHSTALRLAGATFALLPGLERIIVSGYSQRLNKALGHVEDQYLLSADIDRARFCRINFSNLPALDPIEALASFSIKRNMTSTGIFKPVEPFGPQDL